LPVSAAAVNKAVAAAMPSRPVRTFRRDAWHCVGSFGPVIAKLSVKLARHTEAGRYAAPVAGTSSECPPRSSVRRVTFFIYSQFNLIDPSGPPEAFGIAMDMRQAAPA
jgi:hypothetical protein